MTCVLSGYAKYLGDNVRQICLQSSWLGNSAIEAQVLFNLARDFLWNLAMRNYQKLDSICI